MDWEYWDTLLVYVVVKSGGYYKLDKSGNIMGILLRISALYISEMSTPSYGSRMTVSPQSIVTR